MKQHPFGEASSHSAGQDITYRLWNVTVYYLVHKSQSLDSVLNYFIAVHYPTYGFLYAF
jgi:hypothetical protein